MTGRSWVYVLPIVVLVGVFLIPASHSAATPVPEWAAATSGPDYWQFGADSNPEDQQFETLGYFQGVGTELKVHSEKLLNGGCHFDWVAAGVQIPNGTNAVFVQIGYSLCGTGPAFPFVYSSGSTLPGSNVFLFFKTPVLHHSTWYTFSFSTDGVQQPDGTYNWQFYVQPRHQPRVLLTTVPFESPEAGAPYLVTEIGGSDNACGDAVDVSYGQSSALIALRSGTWQPISHATATYGFGPCSNGNVAPHGVQNVETVLGKKIIQKTPIGALVW